MLDQTSISSPLKAALHTNLAWGGVPLIIAISIQGLPLGKEVMEPSPLLDPEKHIETAEQVSSLGYTQTIVPLAIWGSLYVIAGLLLLTKRPRSTLFFLRRQWPLTALIFLVLASALWSPNTAKVASNFVHAMGGLAIALAAAFRYQERPSELIRHLAFALTFMLVGHLSVVAALPQVGINFDDRWMGLFSNPNTLGAAAFCTAWANGISLSGARGGERFLHFFGLFAAAAALLGSGSVTSTIVSLIALAIAVFCWSRIFRATTLLALTMLSILLVSTFLWFDFLPMWELVAEAFGRSPDVSGRVFLWSEAWDLITRSPWLGWGFDDNALVITETGMPHTTYHNGFLDLAVRGGSVAIVLLIAVLAIYFHALPKTRWRDIAISLPFVVAMLVFNITEVSLAASRNLLWLIFLSLIATSVLANRNASRHGHPTAT